MLVQGIQHKTPQIGDLPRILAMPIQIISHAISGISKTIAAITIGRYPPVGSIGPIMGRAINAKGKRKRMNHHIGFRAILSMRKYWSIGIKANQANGVLVFLAIRNNMTQNNIPIASGIIEPSTPSPVMTPCHCCNCSGDTNCPSISPKKGAFFAIQLMIGTIWEE